MAELAEARKTQRRGIDGASPDEDDLGLRRRKCVSRGGSADSRGRHLASERRGWRQSPSRRSLSQPGATFAFSKESASRNARDEGRVAGVSSWRGALQKLTRARPPLATAYVAGCVFGVWLFVFGELGDSAPSELASSFPSSSSQTRTATSRLSLRAVLAWCFWGFLIGSAFVPRQRMQARAETALVQEASPSLKQTTNSSLERRGRSAETDLKFRACTLFLFGACSGFFASLLCWGRLSCLEASHYLYILLLVAHHGSEYLFVKACHPRELSFDAFLLNNSPVYASAILLSLFEIQIKRGLLGLVFGTDLGLVGLLVDSQLRLPAVLVTLRELLGAIPSALWTGGRAGCVEGAEAFQRQLTSLLLALAESGKEPLPTLSRDACASVCAAPWRGLLREKDVCLQLAVVVVLPLALSALGFVVSACGLLLRISGFATLASNFTHQIRREKTKDHALVNWGVYGVYRHPAYAGWFWWAVGASTSSPRRAALSKFAKRNSKL